MTNKKKIFSKDIKAAWVVLRESPTIESLTTLQVYIETSRGSLAEFGIKESEFERVKRIAMERHYQELTLRKASDKTRT
jgi:hypothetical protein